ncbi:MAG: hypothetical protein SP4CHLAM5_08010 [Chlamydiia bacterium]|nr:hypothetical protein [Chlamydiia bacterium]MCH9618665.1 hypothetical protein [Chlamydiia bacterium]MCH9623856.1 hypothetical protein [Chlamydiia bacterium]
MQPLSDQDYNAMKEGLERAIRDTTELSNYITVNVPIDLGKVVSLIKQIAENLCLLTNLDHYSVYANTPLHNGMRNIAQQAWSVQKQLQNIQQALIAGGIHDLQTQLEALHLT